MADDSGPGPVTVQAPALVVAPPNDAPRVSEPMSPTTTTEEDKRARGRRSLDFIWETTQGIIALSVTWATLFVLVQLSIVKNETALNALCSMFGLIIGFYFGRTNHARSVAGPVK